MIFLTSQVLIGDRGSVPQGCAHRALASQVRRAQARRFVTALFQSAQPFGIAALLGLVCLWAGSVRAMQPPPDTDVHPLPEGTSPGENGDPWGADSSRAADLLGAAPENLNPGLYVPPPPSPEAIPDPVAPAASFWQPETLILNVQDDFNNFAQGNRILEPTVTGRLANGDRLSFSTGLNSFTQPAVDRIVNIPLKTAWTGQMGDFTTTLGAGVDWFNRLPTALNLTANTTVPLGPSATLSLNLDQGPYKANAATLENQITAWRYGPNLFWQITPDTSLFSLLRLGHFNDGNWEQQSFSRLEHRLGEFSVAGNLFNWHFSRDLEATSGYFSPPDFVVANGELGWRGQVLPDLACRAVANLGSQRLLGEWSLSYGYRAFCTVQLNQVEIDLGYAFSNVAAGTGGSEYSNRTLQGQLRSRF